MSKLKLNITMSIDGFVAGPDQSPEHPLGVGGEELHELAVPAQGVPREPRRGRRRGQREHAVRRGHPRRRRRDHHGPEHVRRRPGTVGRVVEGLVGRRSALPPSRLRPHAPSARARWRCRAERRSTSSRTGSSRRSNRRGRQPERRTCRSAAGIRRAAIPRSGPARRDRRLGRPDPARRRRSAVRKRGRCEARAGRVGRGARGDSHQIRPGIALRWSARCPRGTALGFLESSEVSSLVFRAVRRAGETGPKYVRTSAVHRAVRVAAPNGTKTSGRWAPPDRTDPSPEASWRRGQSSICAVPFRCDSSRAARMAWSFSGE